MQLQKLVENIHCLEFNGSPVKKNKDEDFEETEIDIEKKLVPEKDNERATYCKEVPIISST